MVHTKLPPPLTSSRNVLPKSQHTGVRRITTENKLRVTFTSKITAATVWELRCEHYARNITTHKTPPGFPAFPKLSSKWRPTEITKTLTHSDFEIGHTYTHINHNSITPVKLKKIQNLQLTFYMHLSIYISHVCLIPSTTA